MRYRPAQAADVGLLTEWNRQMIGDQGHDNPMTLEELKQKRDRRLVMEVLVGNEDAIAFWRAIGFKDRYLGMERKPS